MQSPCQIGNAHLCNPAFIRESIRAAAAALDVNSLPVESGEHVVSIGGLIEIQAILFDCRGMLPKPYWAVRRIGDLNAGKSCACGMRIQEAEIGTYHSFPEASAVAIGEFVRMTIIGNCQSFRGPTPKLQPAICCEAGHFEPAGQARGFDLPLHTCPTCSDPG